MDVKRIHNPFLSITYLKIRNQILNLEAISVLFPNLEVLRIEGCKIISNEEKVIFKDIVELELRELTINEFPQFIFKFPNLSHLLIEGENSTKICIPYNLIELKNLRQVGFYNLEVLQFDYPLSEIYIDDFNMFALHMENCTIHDFPKQIINAAENFYFYHNNCEFKSFSSNQLKVFYDRFPIGLD